MSAILRTIGAAGLLLLAGCAGRQPNEPALYPGFDSYRRPVSTSSAAAQRWFDQGIQLLYGFNHDEAIRSFRRAAQIDPNCAMAWWGVAYAHGLHINNPQMGAEQSRQAHEAAQTALAKTDHARPVEQALIRAVAARYEWPAPQDRRPLDERYAAEMQKAYAQFPDDADVAALYAESLMNLQPWDLYTLDGQPKGRAEEIVRVLEHALKIDPQHPGANHFYIHAVEASLTPERAVPAADRLCNLVPGSGHLVHMPSHIYIRTGRYAEGLACNQRAIAADERYFARAPKPAFYRVYFMHNIHFLAYSAMMEGRLQIALDAARRLEQQVPEDFLREYVKIADGFMPTALHVLIRFGRWQEILNEPAPPDYRLLSRAERHFARAVALANLGRPEQAREELRLMDQVAAGFTDEWFMGNNKAAEIVAVSRKMAQGEIAFQEGRRAEAFALLREAVALEEALRYDEPPGWMQPVRHALGALLLADGRAAEAEQVYRADLKRHPENAWALLGLEQALRMQQKTAEAGQLQPRVAAAWARADVQPHASCYCRPREN